MKSWFRQSCVKDASFLIKKNEETVLFSSHHDELEINDIIQRSLKLQENIESGKPIPCGEGWTLRNLSDEEMKELMLGNCQYCNNI